jgi:hypothetical protein
LDAGIALVIAFWSYWAPAVAQKAKIEAANAKMGGIVWQRRF